MFQVNFESKQLPGVLQFSRAFTNKRGAVRWCNWVSTQSFVVRAQVTEGGCNVVHQKAGKFVEVAA